MFLAFPVVLPDLAIQKTIANFLDEKTALIDELIAKKEKMIELLEEQRQATINQAVTKGLDPTVPMKDSGIEWIGEIREDWEVIKLKYLIEDSLLYGANESGDRDDPKDPRYIRITDFGNDGNLKKETFKSLPYELAEDYLLSEGDILFARSGATVGKTFQFKNYNGLACFAGYLIKATPDIEKMTSDYLYFYTKSMVYENWKSSIFIQATIQNIGADKYQNLLLTIPKVKEQLKIVEFISGISEDVNKQIDLFSNEIEKLKEYKSALIFNAVTGKIQIDG
jgi:type I restriction enzyme S subunit